MEFSDKDYDRVVAKIFDSVKHKREKIPVHKVMKMIAPYVGSDRTEFKALKDILDPFSNNVKIDQHTLKAALLKWTENIKIEKDTCIVEDISMMSNCGTPDQAQYISFGSMSSDAYRERIAELQSDVAERDHHMRTLRKQLDHAALLTQQHEDTLTMLVSEREQLRNKLHAEQTSNAASTSLKKEYEDLIECLNALREKSSTLQTKLDMLKKENFTLGNKINQLDNEKHSLTQLLAQSNEDKNKAIQLLYLAQSDIESLRKECFQLNERIYEQEKTIQHLTSVKCSLEIDLQNTINRSMQQKMKKDDSFEDKIDKEASGLDLNFNIEKSRFDTPESDNNAVVIYTAEPLSRSKMLRYRFVRTLKRVWSNMLHNVLFWGTLICFSLSYLRLFNTMKYCNIIKNGSNVRFYPWEWISINEIVFTVFDFKNNGPVPI